jgi:hypothetical protein
MPNKRKGGRVLLNAWIEERWLKALDSARGGETRAVFVRRALLAALRRHGAKLEEQAVTVPDPVKKRHRGPRPRKKAGESWKEMEQARLLKDVGRLLQGRMPR